MKPIESLENNDWRMKIWREEGFFFCFFVFVFGCAIEGAVGGELSVDG
jgi:hypothetical protein